jgi:hypothetical protein
LIFSAARQQARDARVFACRLLITAANQKARLIARPGLLDWVVEPSGIEPPTS